MLFLSFRFISVLFKYAKNAYPLRAFFPVPGATVNDEPIVLLDDDFESLDAPLANALAQNLFNEQEVELSQYCYEKIWMSVEQIADPTFLLHDTQRSYVKDLFASMYALRPVYRN